MENWEPTFDIFETRRGICLPKPAAAQAQGGAITVAAGPFRRKLAVRQ
jgi:hypothetical protein